VVVGLALVTGLVFLVVTTQRSGVLVRSVDKRLKIYSFEYFPEASMDFSYPPAPRPPSKLRIQWTILAHKFRLYQPRSTTNPLPLVKLTGPGPALVVLGQIAGGDSHWLELVTQHGETIHQSAPMHALIDVTNLFLWHYPLMREGKKERFTL